MDQKSLKFTKPEYYNENIEVYDQGNERKIKKLMNYADEKALKSRL